MKRFIIISSILVIFLSLTTFSANADYLENRSCLEFRAGIMNHNFGSETFVSPTGMQFTTDKTAYFGSIGYARWFKENIALTLIATYIRTENNVIISQTGSITSNNSIIPVYLGLRYYLFESMYGKGTRPYLSVAGGPVIGKESSVIVVAPSASVSSHTETAFGFKAGMGINFMMSNNFMLDLDTGYNLISKFSEPIGGEDNFSGFEFSAGFSLLFGGAKE